MVKVKYLIYFGNLLTRVFKEVKTKNLTLFLSLLEMAENQESFYSLLELAENHNLVLKNVSPEPPKNQSRDLKKIGRNFALSNLSNFLGPMAEKRVEALEARLEGEVGKLQTDMGSLNECLSAVERRFGNLEEMMKHMLKNQAKATLSKARGNHKNDMPREDKRVVLSKIDGDEMIMTVGPSVEKYSTEVSLDVDGRTTLAELDSPANLPKENKNSIEDCYHQDFISQDNEETSKKTKNYVSTDSFYSSSSHKVLVDKLSAEQKKII
ncbi:hypothetical protein IEQ34_001297 [Dendrobium chrysotoxum]|uniref:Uncharacterized protein n=1 Tax=Dendrobium chrysotoxum TaxID=161865 RepID=A0AAV7H7D4_DENCH|nr:hypothetical protein IEQ34_001297 [Dendrobium chrysotoxum]